MRARSSVYRGFLALVVSAFAACSSGGGAVVPDDNDNGRDMAMPNSDGGDREDLTGRDLTGYDLSSGNVDLSTTSGLPCIPGTYRCGAGNSVEICNSTGSAWLHSATCAVSCSAGLCTGACTPKARRCNAKNVEECNSAGTTWASVETCSGSCSSGKCALASLGITMNQNLDGEIFVDGDVIVYSGVTVSVPSGELTIRAKNIIVENMATITAASVGSAAEGRGGNSTEQAYGGGGGGNGGSGSATSYAPGGASVDYDTDIAVHAGGNGGDGAVAYGGRGGQGGGVIRLIASNDISVAGFVTANGAKGNNSTSGTGAGGGGAGGSVLLAASGKISMTGSISVQPGAGGTSTYSYNTGGAGAQGRVKILAGDTRTISGSVNGRRTEGLLAPLSITSSSHPDPSLIYNDNFDTVEFTWTSPFASRQGYYNHVNTTISQVPTPAIATFVTTESKTYPSSALKSGMNYFHLTPVDAMTMVGTIESRFSIQVNATPVTITSSSHASSSTWYANPDVFFSWSLPLADRHQQGVYYVFDNFGDTMPDKSAAFVPLPQKTLLRSAVTQGIWVLHVVAMDQRGYLTKAAQHFRVKVGTDPGDGVVLGQVTGAMGVPISNATVSINRGLWSMSTNSTGNFNFPTVSAGTYELRVTAPGKTPSTQMITVTKAMSTTANVSLP